MHGRPNAQRTWLTIVNLEERVRRHHALWRINATADAGVGSQERARRPRVRAVRPAVEGLDPNPLVHGVQRTRLLREARVQPAV